MLFHVRLSNFAAYGLSLRGISIVRPIHLYMRIDFGGKIHTTEPFEGVMVDPMWRFDTSFDFPHPHGSVEDLRNLKMEVSLLMANSGQGGEVLLGRYSRDLLSTATSETCEHFFPLDIPHAGEARFHASMEEVASVTVRLLDLSIDQLPPRVSSDPVCPYVSYCVVPTLTPNPCVSKVKLSDPTPRWSDAELPGIQCRTTIPQLLTSSLSLKVHHAAARVTPNYADVVIATCLIPLGPLMRCKANHHSRFSQPLELQFMSGPYNSAVRGTLEFANLPRVVPHRLSSESPPVHPPAPLRGPLPTRPTEQRASSHDRARLIDFLLIHEPRKVADVDEMLQIYAGREQDLFRMLAEKYSSPPHNQKPSEVIGGPRAVVNPGRSKVQTEYEMVMVALKELEDEEKASEEELARRRLELDQQEEDLLRVLDKLEPLLESY